MEPRFLKGVAGPIFSICFSPPKRTTPQRAFLLIPAFAEEMNRARRVMADTARRLAAHGGVALILDPYGTGDSGGDFSDARWETWLADLAMAGAWIRQRHPGIEVRFIGLRLGALLGMTAWASHPNAFDGAILWQPVLRGATFLTQFLRLRLAADLKGSKEETTQSLRAKLGSGQTIEVAGYALSPELAHAIDHASLDAAPPPPGAPVHWIDIAPSENSAPSPAGRALVSSWQDSGRPVTSETVVADAFWTTSEITLAPTLVEATARAAFDNDA